MPPRARDPSLYVLLSLVVSVGHGQAPNSEYTVNEGDPLTIPCRANVSAFYHWTRNGVILTNATPGFAIIGEDGDTLNISHADHTLHTASYTCTVIPLDGSIPEEASFTITVHYINSDISLIRTHRDCVPDVNTAYFTYSLTLECLPPEGDPMVNVTWYRNGIKIRRRDHPRVDFSNSRREMVISSLAASDTGDYHCEAANSINKDDPLVSEKIYIMVLDVPEAVDVPVTTSVIDADQALIVGEGLSVEIVCKILPPVHVNEVLWYHNTDRLLHGADNGGVRFVQRTHNEQSCLNSLFLDNVTAVYEGIYECRHSGSEYIPTVDTQRELVLASLLGPLIVEATPTNLIAVGRELRLTCRLGDDAISEENNVPLEDYVYHWTLNGIEMNAGREIVIPSAGLEDSGRYECTVNSPPHVSSSISATIDVTVEASPAVSISPWGEDGMINVELGSSLTLQCYIEATRNSTFIWYPRPQVEAGVVVSSPVSSTLTFPRITLSLLTSYYCNITDTVHTLDTPHITLRETPTPYVRNAAAGVQAAEFENGTTLELTCEVRGGRGEDVRWLRGDTQLTNQTRVEEGLSVAIVTDGNYSTLTIYGVTPAGMGEYECVLEHPGMESRRTFNVIITVPAKIEYTSDQGVTVVTGERVQFDCFTSGTPRPTINWLYNSQPVTEDDIVVDQGNGSLLIKAVSPAHAGAYYCYLLDNGEISQEFTLVVKVDNTDTSDGMECGGDFSHEDCITLLSGGAVAVFFLLLAFLVLLICLSVLCHRWQLRGRALDLPHDLDSKGVLSSRASSHKDNGAAPSLNDTHNYMSTPGYGKGLYPASIPMTSFNGTLLSEMQRSVTPPAPSPVLQTPGTGATDSMFSSDDQSSLTASLPNFPRSQLKLGEELGEGEFGPVVLGVARNIVSHEDTTQVVVKVLVRSGDGEDQFQPDLALVDFANQMKLEYEHIACILGLCTDTEPYYVLYEYLDQGDLKKYLLTHRPVPGEATSLTPRILSRLVLQVADGMAFLFSQRIIHGDLACRNCLVSSDHHIKIADLGIGHDLYQTDYYDNGSQLLPIRWMPPELLVTTDDGPAFSLHSDIWSFGVLCWEVFSFAELPYEGLADEEVLQQVPQGYMLATPTAGCPDHIQRVMDLCWQRDPEARPRFSSLCMDMNTM